MRFTIYQESKLGARIMNEDRMGFCYSRDSLLMVVADGMGGHNFGEVAAQIAVQTLASWFQHFAKPSIKNPTKFLHEGIMTAHREVLRYQTKHELLEAPRTTIVACIVQDESAWWAHVGDSRLYVLRGGEIFTHTKDHTKVQRLIDQGVLHPDDAKTHPERNKVYNCIGAPSDPAIELSKRHILLPNDTVLLCSDGVWGALPDDAIANAFAHHGVMVALPELMEQAVTEGGVTADNATAIAMTWEGLEYPTSQAPASNSLSTATLPIGTYTTTIRAPRYSETEDITPLSDADIEDAIAEINAAIARSKTLDEDKT